ncbi:TadE/TadG family type IV pilus assembly protein [Streptomyces gamaensis]|uniref:TadE/TadG family type IV pilus assembly protein n=1 Tax=Streptomyces gamaensis TaxID=1763542 RepID=A0ABW0YU43_9ACTN
MTIRILPAVGDVETARALGGLLPQLPGALVLHGVGDSARLLDALATLAAASVDELPEVVLLHERIGPLPALDVLREVALRFPAVGVVLVTADPGPALYAAAMDCGARGLVALPFAYEELAARVQAAAQWAGGMRRHLAGGDGGFADTGPGGTLVALAGAKGGVGTTVTAVHLALAAHAAGRRVALVDLDLQSGDIASYLDVQFRRSVADLAGINDISARVLQDAVFPHPSGLGLLLAPGEGERGEDVGDLAARQIAAALRRRYEVVVVDCGTYLTAAGAAVVETADLALLLTTPDVVCVRAAKRAVRLWDRLQIRKADGIVTVVNRLTRGAEIQPPLVARTTGTRTARTAIPAAYKELRPAVDSGRLQDLDAKSSVRQAMRSLAGELGLAGGPVRGGGTHAAPPDRSLTGGLRRRRALSSGAGGAPGGGGTGADQLAPVPPQGRFRRRGGGDRGQITVEFAGVLPLILLVLAVIWQVVLVGYTYALAGDAADKGARAGAVGHDCAAAARADLPGAWTAEPACTGTGTGLIHAEVALRVPALFPGAANWPWTVTGSAGAAEEERR